MSEVFHPGELAVQKRARSPDAVQIWAKRMMRRTLDEPHQVFFSQLPFLVLSARDAQLRPWATLLVGEPGFAIAEDETRLRVQALPAREDPLFQQLTPGTDVGLLGIELHSRRRNRLNGVVENHNSQGFTVGVRQSYGNCPKYIVPRAVCPSARPVTRESVVSGRRLGASQRALLAGADTFFIASGLAEAAGVAGSGMDVSHRGGAPGFVVADDDRSITFPDYSGNNMFNTLGNLHSDPRAGLVFVELETGTLLQMTGEAEVIWESERREKFPGAQRLVHFVVDEFVWRPGAARLRFARVPTTHGAPLAP